MAFTSGNPNPMAFYALPQSIVRAILDSVPYQLRAGLVQRGNPLLTYTNARKTYDAFKKLRFLAVANMFMTPTAALADIVLPVASYLEYDSVIAPPYHPVVQAQQKVAQIGECRSDYGIVRGLFQRLGLGEYFWDREVDSFDYILEPVGLTFAEFHKIGVLMGQKEYRTHIRDGFATPSGKVELFSKRLMEWGFDPLPVYHELPETPYGTPELAPEFSYVFTSWKSSAFRHSSGRQIESLRNAHTETVVWIHPDSAGKEGIAENDWVYLETPRGRIRQKVRLTDEIDPRVLGIDYGWWFPERNSEDGYS